MSEKNQPKFEPEAIDLSTRESDQAETSHDEGERMARKQEVIDAQAGGPDALADFLLKDEIERHRKFGRILL